MDLNIITIDKEGKLKEAMLGTGKYAGMRFSYREAIRQIKAQVTEGKLTEANAASAIGQLFRYGIQTQVNEKYNKVVGTVYQNVVEEVPSDNLEEHYAPLFQSENPVEVARGGSYTEGKIVGEDVVIQNTRYGRIEAFEYDLFRYDQTGQIARRAGMMGQRAKITKEIVCMSRMTGLAQTVSGVKVRKSATFPAGVFLAATGNRVTTYAAISQGLIEEAYQKAMTITDPNGNIFMVTPDTLLYGTTSMWSVPKLLNSTLNPAGAQSAGVVGGVMMVNPLKGLFTPQYSRYLPTKFWAIGQKGAGIALQQASPLEVVQEVPNSGKSFEKDEMRVKTMEAYQCDWYEPRFWICGNYNT